MPKFQSRTFFIIKPDALVKGHTDDIIAMIEQAGLRVPALFRKRYTKAEAEMHYFEHAGRSYFDGMVEFMTEGPVWVGFAYMDVDAAVDDVPVVGDVTDDSAVQKLRELVGPYANPSMATIRGKYGVGGTFRNLIHSSDSPEAAAREARVAGYWMHTPAGVWPSEELTDRRQRVIEPYTQGNA